MHVGFIGAGGITDTHIRAARSVPGLEMAAIFGDNRQKAARLAAEHGAVAYDDLERFLAHRPMEFVAIGSPSGLHGEQGMAAARHGLHVLVEKPIEITTRRADALIDAAEAAGVELGVFFQDRLRPAVAEMKALLDGGQLGSPVMISGRVKWYRPPELQRIAVARHSGARWRWGADRIEAIHTLDLMVWLFGRVTRVYGAAATRMHRIDVEDTLTAGTGILERRPWDDRGRHLRLPRLPAPARDDRHRGNGDPGARPHPRGRSPIRNLEG